MDFNDFVHAVFFGGTITVSIFLLLVVLSVVTWGVIIGKIVQLRNEDQNSGKFVKAFKQSKDLKKFLPANHKRAPVDYDLGILFEEIMHEAGQFAVDFPHANWQFTSENGLPPHLNEMLDRTMDRVNLQMRERREKRLAYLAKRANIKVCIDNKDNLTELSSIAASLGSKIGVLIEVDTSMGRAGV